MENYKKDKIELEVIKYQGKIEASKNRGIGNYCMIVVNSVLSLPVAYIIHPIAGVGLIGVVGWNLIDVCRQHKKIKQYENKISELEKKLKEK